MNNTFFGLTGTQLHTRRDTGLICPRSAHVSHGVAPTAKHEQRPVERFYKPHAVGVTWAFVRNDRDKKSRCATSTTHRKVQAPKLVT